MHARTGQVDEVQVTQMSGVTDLGGALRYSGFRVQGLGLGDSSPVLGVLGPYLW